MKEISNEGVAIELRGESVAGESSKAFVMAAYVLSISNIIY